MYKSNYEKMFTKIREISEISEISNIFEDNYKPCPFSAANQPSTSGERNNLETANKQKIRKTEVRKRWQNPQKRALKQSKNARKKWQNTQKNPVFKKLQKKLQKHSRLTTLKNNLTKKKKRQSL